MQVLMDCEKVGQDTRCRVSKMSCKRMFWEFDINSADDFENFIKVIARAWADAETDKQGLHLHCNQVDKSDL